MKSIRFPMFVAALAISASLSSAIARAKDAPSPPAAAPAARPDTVIPLNRDGSRHKSFNARVKQGNVDLIFIGDSITHGWEGAGKDVWQKFYAKRNAVNLGIGGDRTQHVLWRLENGNIDGISPKLAVLMIGTNNSGGNKPEDIAEGIKAIVEKLRAKLPQTKVLILGIFPRGPNNQDRLRQVNMKTNEIVSKLADDKAVFYLDIGQKFLKPDGTLPRDIMPDLLHLSPQGYTIWAEAFEPELNKLLGEKTAGPADKVGPAADLPIAPGPFKPDMESLKQYECPEWFRDAKFGIWAHWGPQAVPMDGDWYARGMYEQGSQHYNYHVKHYGHPSEFGYKDIIPLWKAEKWDPDRLMQLYKKAGAKYFVSMGSHHDNFFLWNSKLHKWNAVNMGPKRDVVGDWQKAAKKYGLRFGVSEHLGASFCWFQTSHGADKTGPKAGVPYDGANPQYQDLYHFPVEPGDGGWYSKNPRWQRQWYAAIKELVDNYHPDLLYTDGGVAFGNEVGLSMIAHLYNSDAALHGGRTEAIYTCKQKSDGRWVEDLERGIMPKIDPYPWQTDTSIGDWYYNRNWKFRPVSWVIHMLVDNVSKNGNLLLNVVQRPDGSLDPEVEQMLAQLADWTAIHGEAIHGSRPWLVYGESSVKVKGGSFGENFKYNAREIRFTTKGPVLYAIALGWPEDGQLVVRSLAKPAGQDINNITAVSLLGCDEKLTWKQTADGLIVTLPKKKVSEYTTGLKIIGEGLKPVVAAALNTEH
jgi:alpha-L-fucosidase